jgi:hypothetical protein
MLARVVKLAALQPDWMVLDVMTETDHMAFAFPGHVRAAIGIDLTTEKSEEPHGSQG